MKNLIVLTGAGISAESGLKTFRDSDGLWEGYKIEDVATHEAFLHNPKLVLDFYNMRRTQVVNASPNDAHFSLAALEEFFNVVIITQNVDDLHERAGSSNVFHLHGEILKMRSSANPALQYPVKGDILVGDLAEDGAQLRPDIVWFGEPVPMMNMAIEFTKLADIFVIMGTSLVVYPAASLLDFKPADIPWFVIDQKTPELLHSNNLTIIEEKASIGSKILIDKLKMLI